MGFADFFELDNVRTSRTFGGRAEGSTTLEPLTRIVAVDGPSLPAGVGAVSFFWLQLGVGVVVSPASLLQLDNLFQAFAACETDGPNARTASDVIPLGIQLVAGCPLPQVPGPNNI